MATRGADQDIESATLRVCETRVRSVEEVDAWLKRAQHGDRFVYCTGRDLVRGPTSRRVYELHKAGLVDLVQPKAADCIGYDFKIERRSTPLPRGEDPRDRDEALDKILRALKRAANLGKRCPTDKELAREAELATRYMAAARVRTLRLAGIIKIHTVESGRDAGWRTVTIVETKKQTLLPPSLRALKASVRGVGE